MMKKDIQSFFDINVLYKRALNGMNEFALRSVLLKLICKCFECDNMDGAMVWSMCS